MNIGLQLIYFLITCRKAWGIAEAPGQVFCPEGLVLKGPARREVRGEERRRKEIRWRRRREGGVLQIKKKEFGNRCIKG